MTKGSFSMETTLEILTTGKAGREGHRQWPDEVRARIVSESLRPGVTVNEVAERHGLKPNHLSSWRTMARQGKLVLSVPEDAVEFAAMVVETTTAEPPIKDVSRPEIVVSPINIRLEEGASTARIVAIARAFAALA
ncbi:transposase [Rhizobium sp. DBTS2]|uniref:Transposase n=2 Tax=Mycoplana rhizolycopersici TaxID=2746702 RepID=A0ABX2QIJ0_9HYPH|nr:transposase [Rhizobium rhizolycopersici]